MKRFLMARLIEALVFVIIIAAYAAAQVWS